MPTTLREEITKKLFQRGKWKKVSPEIENKAFEQLKKKGTFDKYIGSIEDNTDIASVKRRLLVSSANDIFPIPEVANKERRETAEKNFKFFCNQYLPNRFHLSWAKTHLESISTMESAVLHSEGCYAFAEPRGSGKTSLCEALALWALLNAHRRFVLIMGATAEHSKEIFDSINIELEANDKLLEDYPEVCYPIVCLNGSYIRSRSQHIQGHPTRITWRSDGLSLPDVPGSKVSGSTIKCASITGRVRGIKKTRADGVSIRPDFLIIDDPQTDKSAKSPKMIDARERIIVNAVKGLGGPDRSVAAVMPCTVIQSNDLAERFLDNRKKPEWQGRRSKLLDKFPDNMELWKQYAEIRAEGFRNRRGMKEATQFYIANREVMDRGALVTWEDRYDRSIQISALQAAMDLWIDDPITFASEYQNEPLILSNVSQGRISLNSKDMASRLSGYRNGVVPYNTQYVTAGVDIQQHILYYLVVAWSTNYGGIICDYGTYPKQTASYFSAQNPPVTLESIYPELKGLQSPLTYAGLTYLQRSVFSRHYSRDESNKDYLSIDKVLIDKNWNLVADGVETFCKENEVRNVYVPSSARGIASHMLPMDEWSVKGNEKPGNNWRYRLSPTGKARHCIWDTFYWKSRVAERLLAPKGSDNALLLYGDGSTDHKLLSDHLATEYSETIFGRGRYVDVWQPFVSMSENHWWDCLNMAAVAASMCGLELHDKTLIKSNASGTGSTVVTIPTKKPRRLVTADMYKKK